ncbi:efflux RND transporter periplasmic adaptor subunit [Legionella dresdenensis]|uniref:Efflux RND transporter periplasmic adaptor subunit n=1 Tax=Legionella dresdenensis TaxID=450200 RepID=A0ABV8CEC4_9GAMM
MNCKQRPNTAFIQKNLKKIIFFLLVINLAIAVWYYFLGSAKPQAINDFKLVEATTLVNTDIEETIRLTGTLRPQHFATLIAKGTGRFDALAKPGQQVHKGELIAKIDNPALEKSLQYSESIENIARTQFERLQSILKSGYVSSKETEEKKQAWIEAQKEIERIKQELDNLRFYAPFDGVVGAYKKREGMQVNVGDQIVSIYDPGSLLVEFDVPCTNLPPLQQGQSVHILNKTYAVDNLQNMIDDDTHMCPADVQVSCTDCLVGSTVDVDLVIQKKQKTLVVPIEAVFLRAGKSYVYRIEEGKALLAEVKTGIKNKSLLEIASGLESGQSVIIKGQERLYPGVAVKVYQPGTQDK